MPESLKDLRRRVRTIKSTKQITRAMEMVSASKLRRAQAVLLAARPYASRLQRLLSFLAGGASVSGHPLFDRREGDRRVLVVFTADRGLCGAFNANIIKLAERTLRAEPDARWELICVGKRGADYFRRRDWPIARAITDLSGSPDLELAREISGDLVDRFTSGAADAVHLCYPAFVSLAINRPTVAKFLSLDAESLASAGAGETEEEAGGAEIDYILEPSPERVFNSLLPRYLTSRVYITFAEVFTSEHSARMIAMNNATNNCDELGDSLTLKLNKARQAQITGELLDIVGGAQAV